MSKKILKYISIVLGVFLLSIIYLSTVGIETEKFNKQIQDLIKQKNDKLETIDPERDTHLQFAVFRSNVPREWHNPGSIKIERRRLPFS